MSGAGLSARPLFLRRDDDENALSSASPPPCNRLALLLHWRHSDAPREYVMGCLVRFGCLGIIVIAVLIGVFFFAPDAKDLLFKGLGM
jgi:hypothetical protein